MPVIRIGHAALLLAALLFLGGCGAQSRAPERPTAPRADLDFSRGVAYAVDDLFTQLQRLPAFAPVAKNPLERAVDKVVKPDESAPRKGVILVDTIIDSSSGQQTRATQLVEQRLYDRVKARFPQFEVSQMRPEILERAEYVIAATMTPTPKGSDVHRLSMAMTEVASSLVVAQSAVRIRDASIDTTPTAFYRESPAFVRDRVVEGQVRTAETATGGRADSVYLEKLPTNALINSGLTAFNRADYATALRFYEEAAGRTDGQQLRVFNGLYMSHWNLGRPVEAEAAFGRIGALGLATNNLAVKFLFRPGSTDFVAEQSVSGPYPFWLKQIGRQLASSRNCLAIVGHGSRTGSEETNDRLSLQRAEAIKARLLSEGAELVARLNTSGAGFRENIIGSGTDDHRDALDRRVEFRVVECGARQ